MRNTVFKFGGASVRDAARIRNLKEIIEMKDRGTLVLVISAMGKNTNLLESHVKQYVHKKKTLLPNLKAFSDQHIKVGKALGVAEKVLRKRYEKLILECLDVLKAGSQNDKAFIYDQIVCLGELFSTALVHGFLKTTGRKAAWMDVRKVLKTNATHQEGKVDFKKTSRLIKKKVNQLSTKSDVIVTQGFLGGAKGGVTTTLGREGSDYTAAIIAYALEVEELTIWKDVPGILTADPRRFDNVDLIKKMSYREAIEMTYYGAQVIHPKTIQPIQNKRIKLQVRSFINPKKKGTTIWDYDLMKYPPIVVIQDEVILIQLTSRDFSFISEEHLGFIFERLTEHQLKLCAMRNSAVSFTLCVRKIGGATFKSFVKSLNKKFSVEVTNGLQLLTVRHYNKSLIKSLTENKVLLFEKRQRNTIQLVLKESPQLTEKN